MSTAPEMQYLEADEVDLRALASTVWARRYLILGCMLFFTVIFTSYAFLATPIYRSTVTLIAANAEKSASGVMEGALSQLGGAASLVGGFEGGSTVDPVTAEAMAVLQSREFTEKFINEKNLMPEIFLSRWDKKNNKWKESFLRSDPTITKGYDYFDKKIRSLTIDKKTTLLTLQIDWRDRNEAADWANELVQRLNAEMRARAISKTKASMEFLQSELNKTSYVGTQEAINRLIETQVKLRMLANVTEDYSFRIVDKALPADKDDMVNPNRVELLVVGPLIGLFFGVFYALVAGALENQKIKQLNKPS